MQISTLYHQKRNIVWHSAFNTTFSRNGQTDNYWNMLFINIQFIDILLQLKCKHLLQQCEIAINPNVDDAMNIAKLFLSFSCCFIIYIIFVCLLSVYRKQLSRYMIVLELE
ncbi:hypothetical protein RFI_15330 [Reticulomyxa filosa]|uniref:Transmembrane protein n=1 Tax=Reticulomyxa filosa TaxID=46433 RepID=X6N819_RETFI|nr:hypothetical protein RFI_15330 [Reticulomyxa filosa]|eukprot:ETO21874.1 hypothetical protein RFI_15330 [Reticulomyxa filosa]